MENFEGTLTIGPAEALLDLKIMEIADADCGDSDCRRRRARDHFFNQGLVTGSQIAVTGTFDEATNVLTIVR